jgi:hypothetical protein
MTSLKSHAFQDIALTLTGNAVVCTIQGTVSYEISENDVEIDEIHVLTADNALVEVSRHEPMWMPIKKAVSKYLRNLPSPHRRETPIDNAAA